MQKAFLLTRHWRDTPRGLEIELWWSTDKGPLHTRHTGQEAVFFIPAGKADSARQILANMSGWRLKPVALTNREGRPVVALYFRRMALAAKPKSA